MNPSPLSAWILAARPKTLWAAFSPVLMGSALAAADGRFHLLSALAALFGAFSIQIGTNFCNDYADFVKGADTAERKGPARATQSGWISPAAMLRGTVLVFTLAAVLVGYLVQRGGWPVLLIGVLSIAFGALYTAGPKPLAYLGLGDLFVVLFFGPVAVAGTYYVQALEFNLPATVLGIGPGLLSTAILTVNNLRDVEEDEAANKRTLAVRYGPAFVRAEYAVCVLAAGALPLLVWGFSPNHLGAMLAGLILVPGWSAIRRIHELDGAALNPMLGRTAQLLLLYSVLFAAGVLLVARLL